MDLNKREENYAFDFSVLLNIREIEFSQYSCHVYIWKMIDKLAGYKRDVQQLGNMNILHKTSRRGVRAMFAS